MSVPTPNEPLTPEGNLVRHALMHERMCAYHYRTVLAHAQDKQLRGRCRRQLHASLERAVLLAFTLVDMGEEVPMTRGSTEFDAQLLEAMDAALRSGATPAIRLPLDG